MTSGQKFGKLTAIEFTKSDNKRSNNKYWKFKCDCGKETITRATMVKNGHTKSCGCLRKIYWARL